MRNTVAKRIRRINREQFPRTNETPEQYTADIRQLSKENKNLINNRTAKLTQPKPKISARQQRIGGSKKFGFPKGSVVVMHKTSRKERACVKFGLTKAGRVKSTSLKTT